MTENIKCPNCGSEDIIIGYWHDADVEHCKSCNCEWSELLGINRHTIYTWIRRYGKQGTISKLKERLNNE